MATPLIDTLFDLVSATSGALVGAIVTGLFSRGRRRQLSDQVVLGRKELAKVQLENDRLLEMIREKESVIQTKENMILEMQMQIMSASSAADAPPAAGKTKAARSIKTVKTVKKTKKQGK